MFLFKDIRKYSAFMCKPSEVESSVVASCYINALCTAIIVTVQKKYPIETSVNRSKSIHRSLPMIK